MGLPRRSTMCGNGASSSSSGSGVSPYPGVSDIRAVAVAPRDNASRKPTGHSRRGPHGFQVSLTPWLIARQFASRRLSSQLDAARPTSYWQSLRSQCYRRTPAPNHTKRLRARKRSSSPRCSQDRDNHPGSPRITTFAGRGDLIRSRDLWVMSQVWHAPRRPTDLKSAVQSVSGMRPVTLNLNNLGWFRRIPFPKLFPNGPACRPRRDP